MAIKLYYISVSNKTILVPSGCDVEIECEVEIEYYEEKGRREKL
ncbi:MAG: hypothetical protein N2327_02250 [Caldimicrobium sp.]|nr:hypothetical protein [Caldimicrobium sp.]